VPLVAFRVPPFRHSIREGENQGRAYKRLLEPEGRILPMKDRGREGKKRFVFRSSADPAIHSNYLGRCAQMDLGGTVINEEYLEELLRVTPNSCDHEPNWAHVATQVVLKFTSDRQPLPRFRV
jgi:hypothetical protein